MESFAKRQDPVKSLFIAQAPTIDKVHNGQRETKKANSKPTGEREDWQLHIKKMYYLGN